MRNPLVSVIIQSYNHAAYIQQSINSVLNQTYENIELIVIDDCSTDNSALLIEKLYALEKFIFIKNKMNEGLNNSIITGIHKSKGEYISLLASDDFITPEKIADQLNFILKCDYDGIYSNGYILHKGEQKLIKLNKIFNTYRQDKVLKYIYQYDWGAPLLQSALFKKNIMITLIEIRRDFKSDDWAFFIKALENYKIGFINKPYFFYRLHNTNTHNQYWKTFPMRIDIASRLVPYNYRTKTISNIFFSQSQYLLRDKKHFTAIKYFLCSLLLHFSFNKLSGFGKSFVSYFRA